MALRALAQVQSLRCPGLVRHQGQQSAICALATQLSGYNISNSVRSHYSYSNPGNYSSSLEYLQNEVWKNRDFSDRGFTVGIGGPVGSGKTALVLKLTQLWTTSAEHAHLKDRIGVVTNDIFTQEDAEFLTRHCAGVLPSERIAAVETGGCPHAAIREDVSANLSALEGLTNTIRREGGLDEEGWPISPLLLCESGGDNLAANFSRELADLTLYVIDVSGGDKIPRKGGPGITQSDLLIINKVDLAEAVGADLDVMKRDADRMRSSVSSSNQQDVGPTIFAAVKKDENSVNKISDFILDMYQRATTNAN